MNLKKDVMSRFALTLGLVGAPLTMLAETVVESAREIPLIEDVDVVVVGGGFSAVSAAIAAKEAGASVFVVTPRQNPGEDMIATRRLWVSADDENLDDPLVLDLFPIQRQALFSYVPSVKAVSPHQDDQHTVLKDGAWNDATNNSAQYGDKNNPCSSVTFTVTPDPGAYHITAVRLYAYSGTSSDYGGFGTGGLSVADADGVAIAGSVQAESANAYVFTPTTPIAGGTVLTLTAITAENAIRQLIGEIVLETDVTERKPATKPSMIFKALDAALIAAEIPYFTGSPVCDVLTDAEGRVAGVVIANRSGRQAIRAKAVVDATELGSVARKVSTLRTGPATTAFTHVLTVSRDATLDLPSGYVAVEKSSLLTSVTIADNRPTEAPQNYLTKTLAITKTFALAMSDALSVNAIEQTMRNDLWEKSVADQAERPFFVPPESIVSANGTVAMWTSAADVPLTAFCPEGVENVFVAGMMADVDRSIAERLAYPGVGCVIGRRLGAAAAVAAAVPRGVSPAALPRTGTDVSDVEVRESLNRPIGIGSIAAGTVPSRGAALPILAEVDVVVVGGGTAGGPAAIAAASEGKRVLVAEWLHVMGGTTTEGRIATYYHGNDRGFSKLQVDEGTRGNNAIGWVFSETKSEWFRRTAVAAGATVVYGAFAEGVVVSTSGLESASPESRDKVCGVVLVLADGTRGVVRAKAVVDATGNADVAAAAGAETMFLPKEEFSMQGSAASPHVPGRSYYNTDVGFLNNPDAGDLFSFALRARRGISTEKHWNLSSVHVGARERRRIVGDWIVTPEDELIGKTYADTIMHGKSDYDMHGFSTGALMMFHNRPHGQDYSADLPYRALLPRTLEGVLVTGLAISADRDAMPLIRMQRDVQNQGYAAGLAAAMACDAGGVRAIDIRTLQQKLVDAKCLDARVLTETDSGYDAAKAEAAIAALDENFFGLPWILAYPTETKDLVRAAYLAAEAGSEHQKALALALLLIGDETGLGTVIAAFAAADVTQGKNFQGLGNYGRQTSEFDYCLYALSKSASPKAAAAVARRIDEFVNEEAKAIRPYSHFRMAALMSEKLPSERIAARLATLPSRHEAFKSYVKSGTPEAVSYSSDNVMDSERLQAMRELSLARTQYRFGDAKAEASLRKYLGDYRTIYATYAALALGLDVFPPTPGVWTDAETYTVDLGSPAAPATLAGTVSLDEATLRVVARGSDAQPGEVDYKLLPEGDFEPSTTPLPLTPGSTDKGQYDRRAKSHAAYFTANFSTWTFDKTNDGSGITTDGGYFVSTYPEVNSIIKRPDGLGGRHAAFLFLKDGKCGLVSQTFTVPEGGAEVWAKYDVCSRNDGKYYLVAHSVLVDDQVVDDSFVGNSDNGTKQAGWTTREVCLGTLSAGEHTLAFSNKKDSNVGVLIDNVCLDVRRQEQVVEKFPMNQFVALDFDLGQNVTLDFRGTFDIRVGTVKVGGKRQGELTSGDGHLRAKSGGICIMIR